MNDIIEKIEIYNFRSIVYAKIDCKNINVFSGSNDVGKTNILRALNLFFNNKTEFLEDVNFDVDFNKVALLKARESQKAKQLIRIRVHFKTPKSYLIFSKDEKIYLEKTIDRYNTISILTSHEEDRKKKAQISKLFNKINFVYIPALKGRNVIDYLLNLLSSYDLLDETDITTLNDKINVQTQDLNQLLKESGFKFNAILGLPTLMKDFWQKLSVDTQNEAQKYSIPLSSHGEGVKSKFIPNLLMWIVEHSNNYFVWGIDEPENSLEFKQAYELSVLYYENFSKKVQIIFTTHSLSFIYPNKKDNLNIFRVSQNITQTVVESYDNTKKTLNNELGYILLQERLAGDLHKELLQLQDEKLQILQTISNFNDKIEMLNRPIIITEGITDWMHMKKAFSILNLACPFDFIEYTENLGDSNLWKIIEANSLTQRTHKVICIFDRDNPEYLKKLNSSTKEYTQFSTHLFGFCIPQPPHRRLYKNISIEFYYSETDLLKKISNKRVVFSHEVNKVVIESCADKKTTIEYKLKQPDVTLEYIKKIYDTDIENVKDDQGLQIGISKKRFAEAVVTGNGEFGVIDFQHFRLIYNTIMSIINN